MASESQLQEKLDNLEKHVLKQNITTKDKIIHGTIIGSIILLGTSLAIALFPFTFFISLFPLALGPAGILLTPVILASVFLVGSALATKIVKGCMHIAMNRVKKRCSDEINMNAIEKISNSLSKETSLANYTFSNLDIDPSVATDLGKNYGELIALLKEKYNNLKDKPEDLGKAIESINEAVNKTNDSKDLGTLLDAILKTRTIAHVYCLKNKNEANPNLPKNNDSEEDIEQNDEVEDLKKGQDNIDNSKSNEKPIIEQENVQQITPKKEQGRDRDIGNNN